MIRVVLLLFLSIAAASAGAQPRKPAPQPFSAFSPREQEVYLALFHHMFARWQNNKFHFPTKFYITVRGFDALDDLLGKLKAEGYTVAPGYRYRESPRLTPIPPLADAACDRCQNCRDYGVDPLRLRAEQRNADLYSDRRSVVNRSQPRKKSLWPQQKKAAAAKAKRQVSKSAT